LRNNRQREIPFASLFAEQKLTFAQRRSAIRLKKWVAPLIRDEYKRRVAGTVISALIYEGAKFSRVRDRQTSSRIKKLGELLDQLLPVYADDSLHQALAFRLLDLVPPAGLMRQVARYADARGKLARLSRHLALVRRAIDHASRSTPKRGRPREVPRVWLVRCTADVFEYLTGHRASRKIRGEDHPDYGKPYGKFWDFASQVWIELYGSVSGLDDHMRQWVAFRRKGVIKTNFIRDLAASNPKWDLLPAPVEE
jgi:hypothetical protein